MTWAARTTCTRSRSRSRSRRPGAVPRRALVRVGAEGPVGLEAARAVDAHATAHALRVARAGGEAARSVARERGAAGGVGHDAAAAVVARGGRRVDVARAGFDGAQRSGRVRTAVRRRRRTCRRVRSWPDPDRCRRCADRRRPPGRACSGPSTTGARSSGTRRRRLRRSRRRRRRSRSAFARRGARRAVRLRAAASVLANPTDDAVGVGRAARDARAVGAAVWRAVRHAGRAAGADAVAGAGRVRPIAAARRREADRLGRVQRAAADAVAGAGLAARGGPFVAADLVRIGGAAVDRPADAGAADQVAADARSVAGDVAADAVGAEPGRAVRVLAADRPRRLGTAAAVDADDAQSAVRVGSAGDDAGVGRRNRSRTAHRFAAGPALQRPFPSQTSTSTTAPFEQVPGLHTVPAA